MQEILKKYITIKNLLSFVVSLTFVKLIFMVLFAILNFNLELVASTTQLPLPKKDNNLPTKEIQSKSQTVTNEKEKQVNITNQPIHPEILKILQTRNAQLNERLMELEEKNRDLDLVKSEIENRMKELQELEKKLEQVSIEIGLKKKENKEKEKKQKEMEEKVKNERLQYLAGVYSAMDPARAAELLNLMEVNDVAKIFSHMKTKKVAPILAQMNPERASAISRALTTISGNNPQEDDNKTSE